MTRIIVFVLSLLLVSCASSSETAKESEDSESQEVYVFDDMNEETAEVEVPARPQLQEPLEVLAPVVPEIVEFYIVQLGAFTTEARALSFVKENKEKLDYEMTIHFSQDVKLYVVQLPPFRDREKAENVRNSLWRTEAYKDAFIVPK